jgi:hypothetical protein
MKAFLLTLLLLAGSLSSANTRQSSGLIYADMVQADQRAAFCSEVVKMADRLHVEPDWLMICMRFETAGTFRANTRNRYSGAIGLIQFIPTTARRLGTSPGKLSALTSTQQLYYVEKYFQPYAGQMHDVYDCYLVIFAPAFLGSPNKQVLYRADSPTTLGRQRYRWNKVLDSNRDGVITVRDVKRQIRQFVP